MMKRGKKERKKFYVFPQQTHRKHKYIPTLPPTGMASVMNHPSPHRMDHAIYNTMLKGNKQIHKQTNPPLKTNQLTKQNLHTALNTLIQNEKGYM